MCTYLAFTVEGMSPPPPPMLSTLVMPSRAPAPSDGGQWAASRSSMSALYNAVVKEISVLQLGVTLCDEEGSLHVVMDIDDFPCDDEGNLRADARRSRYIR